MDVSEPPEGTNPGSDEEPGQEPSANQLDQVWPRIVENLPPTQRVWLQRSKPLMLAENTAVIGVPNEFDRSQLEGRLRTRLEDALSDRFARPIRIAVSVDQSLEPEHGEVPAPAAPPVGKHALQEPEPGSAAAAADKIALSTKRFVDI